MNTTKSVTKIAVASLITITTLILAITLTFRHKEQKSPLRIQCGTSSEKKDLTINGAGASFPFPVYSQWIHHYEQISGVKVNYQSIGSGGGIAQIKARTVDFGASDAPMSAEEIEDAGLIQFPMIMGGVVIVVNLDGISTGSLRLSRKVLVNIFLGKIKRWNDPAIAAVNPGISLPETPITVVHRSDGSGTTWIFTNYLSKISTEWRDVVGCAKAVKWPVGIGAKGNEGVAAYVQRLKGSIGYVELAYALQNNLTYTLLENKDGNYVAPTMDTFQAAAQNADWSSRGLYVILTDQPGQKSWPITGASFIIIHKEQKNPKKALEMLKFFSWCYHFGGPIARKLHYVPIPQKVVSLVEKMWRTEVKSNGSKVWWKEHVSSSRNKPREMPQDNTQLR